MRKLQYSRRLLFGHIVLFLSAISWITPATADVVPAGQRPGCPSKCGDVDIPFPFGIGEKCAMQTGFQFYLDCSSVDGAPERPFFRGVEVTKISVEDGKAWVKLGISTQCYDQQTGNMTYINWNFDFDASPFWLSADNKIIVIGCHTLAYMQSNSYVIGCYSTCNHTDQLNKPMNGSCSGNGCCQADVPKRVFRYSAYFNENYNTTEIWRSSPCSYMAVMESREFQFSTTYLSSTVFNDTYKGETPVVLDWVVTLDTCEKAQSNTTSYACVSTDSVCVDDPSGGYRCKCDNGFKGNPYIQDGCQDIDECLDRAAYPCPGICNNTVGAFTCTCHPGNYMVNGTCLPNPKPAFPVPAVVGTCVGFVALVIAITCACFIKERRKLQHIKHNYFRQHGGLLLFEEMRSQQGLAFNIFSEEELQQATNKFDQVIGQGGNGTVYKGLLKGNLEVAVKRCMTIDEQKKKEFGKEMLILSQVNHKNIVKLLGCCLEVEVPILVYEFIPNSTLFHLIHGNNSCHISLVTRLRIAHESAEALAYLHSCASPPILHGDVKSSNILLDGNLSAKVSDFGASILAPTDEAQFVTLVQGTCGYLDPEYMLTCQLTDKSDVYSFGVVLLELLTRKKAFNLDAPEHEKSLSMRFLSTMKENKLKDILDEQISNNESMEFLEEVADLAKQCLAMSGENRPSMKEVAEKLDRLIKVMQHPWAQQNPEEMESLLGESSYIISSGVESTGNFSIEKKAVNELESGR
ncbi:hypothetical protein GUJ93_ZPchr0002g26663 [Zizania palustris]|uniref:Protein kinase domain-containing protein n=1 Tax=Zizania palustris TaxID=103762 RepID=A0A8J5VEQ9_ZIZPA|nr:hypothetical protein GUJ93_ZPchr0002g26663 [Zizania palustris]